MSASSQLGFLINTEQSNQILTRISELPQTQKIDLAPYLKPSRRECCIFSEKCLDASLVPLGQKGKIGSLFLLKTNYTRRNLVAKFSPVKLAANFSEKPPREISTKSSICFPLTAIQTFYLGLDEFSNETIIAYILNAVCQPAGYRFVVQYYRSIFCENQGVNVMEFCDLGDLSLFPRQLTVINRYSEKIVVNGITWVVPTIVTMVQIFHQVLAALDFLSQQVGFISGDLKAANIFVKSEESTGSYRGMNIEAPFTCKISDYGKSSCLFPVKNQLGVATQAIRIFNEVSYAGVYFVAGDFEPEFTSSGRYVVDDYLLSNTYANLRHMGSPYFRTYDFYTFVVSLLTVPEFYYRFFTSDYLVNSFWHPLWLNKQEEDLVKERIDAYISKSQRTGIGEAIGIIKGISLSCTILNDLILQQSV